MGAGAVVAAAAVVGVSLRHNHMHIAARRGHALADRDFSTQYHATWFCKLYHCWPKREIVVPCATQIVVPACTSMLAIAVDTLQFQ